MNRNEYLTTQTPEGVAEFHEGIGYIRPDHEYFFVWLEALTPEDKNSRYAFPTLESAWLFACHSKLRHPHRVIYCGDANGRHVVPVQTHDAEAHSKARSLT